ncbi:hypothetical protein QTP88_007590 [Uroleucon formosanum]
MSYSSQVSTINTPDISVDFFDFLTNGQFYDMVVFYSTLLSQEENISIDSEAHDAICLETLERFVWDEEYTNYEMFCLKQVVHLVIDFRHSFVVFITTDKVSVSIELVHTNNQSQHFTDKYYTIVLISITCYITPTKVYSPKEYFIIVIISGDPGLIIYENKKFQVFDL